MGTGRTWSNCEDCQNLLQKQLATSERGCGQNLWKFLCKEERVTFSGGKNVHLNPNHHMNLNPRTKPNRNKNQSLTTNLNLHRNLQWYNVPMTKNLYSNEDENKKNRRKQKTIKSYSKLPVEFPFIRSQAPEQPCEHQLAPESTCKCSPASERTWEEKNCRHAKSSNFQTKTTCRRRPWMIGFPHMRPAARQEFCRQVGHIRGGDSRRRWLLTDSIMNPRTEHLNKQRPHLMFSV
ncbi:hypothetical protein CHS0354_012287 [Potamilus streckersoni]|uniref:Uncharacterized protein n=1 Tax=Potamilus streckersoni TaxID=2493646 RepID=A0AAE0VU28_9BIVA|nr:hypothetical protein CHS0354_012287 [Potamilus streckersoni]